MGIELHYGKTSLTVKLPSKASIDVYSPARVEGPESAEFSATLDNAGLTERLGENSLFVVNDAHRSTPTSAILTLIDEIDHSLLDRASFLVACGTHDLPSDAHLRTIFGQHLDRVKDRIACHSATDQNQLELIGRDQFKENVYLNKAAVEAESVCAISSVEPHYFAGFTGGRKSFFPGLTDLTTVQRNHNLAGSLEAQPMKISGNPVAEHMQNLLSLIDTKKIFSIQTVIDSGGSLVGLFAGDLDDTFGEACELATQLYGYETNEPYDAVLCEMTAPLDANLYQAQKALENCQAATINGGACVVISACEQGIGSPHFYKLADDWDRETNRPTRGPLIFGSHKLARVNLMSRRIIPGLYSELDDATVEHVFYAPINDLNDFLEKQAANKSAYRVAVVRDAGNTVLQLNETGT